MPLRFDDQHEIADVTMGELARLVGALERCRTVLGNMALENEGAFFNRWPICHEPLRADAKGLLPEIDDVLRVYISPDETKWCPFCKKEHAGGGACMGHYP
jgi:hypothetical protein